MTMKVKQSTSIHFQCIFIHHFHSLLLSTTTNPHGSCWHWWCEKSLHNQHDLIYGSDFYYGYMTLKSISYPKYTDLHHSVVYGTFVTIRIGFNLMNFLLFDILLDDVGCEGIKSWSLMVSRLKIKIQIFNVNLEILLKKNFIYKIFWILKNFYWILKSFIKFWWNKSFDFFPKFFLNFE